MNIDKSKILNNICYTELVYGWTNKKLKTEFSKSEIEKMIYKLLAETNKSNFLKLEKLLRNNHRKRNKSSRKT